jgi:ABC-type nitrate/sulfonate/bicarbonate transport system substrate-binding protein
MRPKIAKGIAVPLLGMVLLLGGPAWALEDLKIPVAQTSSTTSLVEQVVIHKGWFKEIGYNARVYSVSGGENAAVLALERGQLPFFGSDDNIALAIRKGSNIKIVGTSINTLPYWLVAGKHVKSYKDLPQKGVRVGISSPTSANVYVSLKLLQTHGITEPRLIKVGGSGARLAGAGEC